MAQPERTCVGCGVKAPAPSLVRLALSEGRVVAGVGRGGRGAWLHPDGGCLDRAVKRGAFARAFRSAAASDVAALRALLTGSVRKN